MTSRRLIKLTMIFLIMTLLFSTVGCRRAPEQPPVSRAGTHVGYSWAGEAAGVAFADATQYIETILELDAAGIITNATMRYFIKVDGFWITRQSGNAFVDVDFSVNPRPAVPGEKYKAGDSMFTVYTADMMSFYAAAVNAAGVAAVALVDPITRYQFEMKLPQNFDYSKTVGSLTIGSGILVPTVRTSAGALLKPADWAPLANNTFLDISPWSHVVNSVGVLQGITAASSVQSFLEALGVQFQGGRPRPLPVRYGYFGLGGWNGNYRAIETSLIGQNATQKTSLVDWSIPRYAGAINDKRQFGVDVQAGATRTAQNSIDTISGATVRMSRESTSYQRALVRAGILRETDVIIGRF